MLRKHKKDIAQAALSAKAGELLVHLVK